MAATNGAPTDRVPEGIEPDTVEALVDTVRALLGDEDAREQSFTARAVGLSGFSGLILSLAGPVSAASTNTSTLNPYWKVGVLALLGVSLAALLLTVITAITGVLRPKEFATIAVSEIVRYPLPEFVEQPRVMVQGRILRGLVDALASERDKNADKARALGRSYWWLLVGLVGVTLLAVILGAHTAGVI